MNWDMFFSIMNKIIGNESVYLARCSEELLFFFLYASCFCS